MHFLLLKFASFVGLQPTQFLERYGSMTVEDVLELWGFPDFGQTDQEMAFLEANRTKTLSELFDYSQETEPQQVKTRRKRSSTQQDINTQDVFYTNLHNESN